MKKPFALLVSILLGMTLLSGCGASPAAPQQSAAAAQGGVAAPTASAQPEALTQEELKTLEPLFNIVASCTGQDGLREAPTCEDASIVVYNMINYDVYTSQDGDRTDSWVSDALLEKVYHDCFADTSAALDYSTYAIMRKKDNGYEFDHSDMGEGPEITVTGSEHGSGNEYEVSVSLKSFEDMDLSGTGTFVLEKNAESKFGYSLKSWQYVWNA